MPTDEKRVWGIHTMDDQLFLKNNVIAIGWRAVGDLRAIAPTRDAFKEKYFVAYLIYCLPTYVSSKYLSYPYVSFPFLWEKLFLFLFRIDKIGRLPNFAKSFSYYVLHKVPVWSIPIAIIVNAVNMIFGFKIFKKKWWYYLILLLSILITIVIIDFYRLESSPE